MTTKIVLFLINIKMSNIKYTEKEVQYLTEIAFIIGQLGYQKEMNKMENQYGVLLDYEDFTDFCIYILRMSQSFNEGESLLDTIGDMLNKKEVFFKHYNLFLFNYR